MTPTGPVIPTTSDPLLCVPATAEALLPALRAALDGSGPPVLPVPSDAAPLLAALRPEQPVEDDVALVVPTSGSTGTPKGVLLSASALRFGAEAGTAALGGPGRWLLAIPATHIGGLQVLVRSLLADTPPVVLDRGPFTAERFVAAVAQLGEGPAYVSLVPTQLRRLLDAGVTSALSRFDAVLLGGAAAAPALLATARSRGVNVVTTYGMSETAGGCVYDGKALPGVRLTLREGRIHVGGPMQAHGYRLRPDLTAAAFGPDGFATGDVGRISDGRLQVLGRGDDLIITGGEKVPPLAVEAALAAHPSVTEAAVVGIADPEWGERVVAVVVLRGPLTLAQAREHVAATLPRVFAPHELLVVESLPLLPSGKLDRHALRLNFRTQGQGT